LSAEELHHITKDLLKIGSHPSTPPSYIPDHSANQDDMDIDDTPITTKPQPKQETAATTDSNNDKEEDIEHSDGETEVEEEEEQMQQDMESIEEREV
jgi:hypothetical protein